MDIGIKKCVAWYREQDFIHMNGYARAELDSIFSPGDGYEVTELLR